VDMVKNFQKLTLSQLYEKTRYVIALRADQFVKYKKIRHLKRRKESQTGTSR
jgi:hypothetical protein